eukprot:TRINITY_DN2557_c0_g2_i1.p1 TRINITY_DN2557_c0_g2~~TRINITY_DN2557_c0_g2_i1.p1  ORF type:complete len:183 (-),score=51.15 TRINITY_DN2557_c0_g2_i1:3-551(-)
MKKRKLSEIFNGNSEEYDDDEPIIKTVKPKKKKKKLNNNNNNEEKGGKKKKYYQLRISPKKYHSIYNPDQKNRSLDPHFRKNYLFYTNQISSQPNGDKISDIHTNWFKDYGKLERHHGYVQWLFPLFESNGMNSKAKKLTKEEAKLFRENYQIGERIIRSYKLMLHFYGIRLIDERTGKVAR